MAVVFLRLRKRSGAKLRFGASAGFAHNACPSWEKYSKQKGGFTVDMLLALLLVVIALIGLIALILSYRVGPNQKSEHDEGAHPAIVKHSVLLNPAFWAYAVFFVLTTLGIWIFYLIVFQY
jgi:uncharacterized membrane protein SpoIIM required for sporulation